MGADSTYQNITATVRPPRCAILINGRSTYWKTAAHGAIAKASEVWGGRYFLIIPTDGNEIAAKYWEILEAYSPDYLAVYNLSFSELENADPETYQTVKEKHRDAWEKKGNPAADFEGFFSESASMSRVDDLQISEVLERELLLRLSPFHHSGNAIGEHLWQRSGFGYPFTKISKILPSVTKHIGMVVMPRVEEDAFLGLLVNSQTGVGSESYKEDVNKQSFAVASIPESYDQFDLFAELAGRKQGADSESYAKNVPFHVNMAHLGQYYRADRHQSHSEPVVVVLGDSVDDFCLYYSLSRVHEGVLWIPLNWLRGLTAALNSRKKSYLQGQKPPSLARTQMAAHSLANLAFELIDYGYGEKRMKLCSMSLDRRQLAAYKGQVARPTAQTSRFKAATDCVDVSQVSTSCMLRVFEEDNYVNHRSMTFIDGTSVSPFDTPKPKSFSNIMLGEHYWLTSLRVDGYQPPSLPSLGPEILQLFRGNSTYESRVANDGIVYHCPNSMIFGNDLDALLVRPKIRLPDVLSLFNAYFSGTGILAQYSDKGKYFNDTVRRFGSLDALGHFIKVQATRSVLDKFLQTGRNAADGVFYLRADQRAYLDLDAFAASIGSKEDAADLVDDLLAKDVIERGYILKCEQCSLSSWYGLGVLSSNFTCNRCGLRQQLSQRSWKNGLVEPRWCYKLAETVYQFYATNSHLTAQVLYRLKSQSTAAFHYAPEIDLINFAGPGKNREMDVACILDGQIIFGECKTETLKLKDAVKFNELLRMNVQKPARVVFATTQKVSDDFKNCVAGIPGAEIMTRAELYDD